MVRYQCIACNNSFGSMVEFVQHNKKIWCGKDPKNKIYGLKSVDDEPKKKPIKKHKKEINIDTSYQKKPTNEKIFSVDYDKSKDDDKRYIMSKIKQAHQILYDAENIEGENAMNDIMNILFLGLIQDKLSDKPEEGKIDLFNKKYYPYEEPGDLDEIFTYFNMETLGNTSLGNLRSKKVGNTDVIRKMGNILMKHPLTRNIFQEENFLKIEKATTLQEFVRTMFVTTKTKWDLKRMFQMEDLIGEIFEAFINGYTKTNSKLSQFFTPRNLMNLVLGYCHKDIRKAIKHEEKYNIADFCMGTAGWLVISYNMFKKDYADKITLSGGEVKPNTFLYGLMNIITTTNNMPFVIHRDNSLTHVDKQKYNLIVTNPPFKTDFKFENIKKNFEDDEFTQKNEVKLDNVYKLKNNSPPIQFMELCIYKLCEGGKCIIVLPYGELFFGPSQKKSRKYFLENIDITHIIVCPSGIFTHTGIKTCVLIFNKDNTGTKEITYLQTNKECTELTKIFTVSKDDIMKESKMSLYHLDYMVDEFILGITEKQKQFEWVEFGKVFTLEKGKIQSSKVEENKDGEGVMVTLSKNINDYKKIKKCDYDGQCLFICNVNGGIELPIVYFNGKCSCTNLLYKCCPNKSYDGAINIKFYYYYLKSISVHLANVYLKGSCNKSLDTKNLNQMKIPMPPIEIQNKKVAQLDFVYEQCIKTSREKIMQLTKMNEIYLNEQLALCGETEIKMLGDVCSINQGTALTKTSMAMGKYDVIGGGKIIGKHNEYNMNGKEIILTRVGDLHITYFDKPYYLTDNGFALKSNNKNILTKYLYYVFCNERDNLSKLYKGLAQKVISKAHLNLFRLPIPETERQEKIVTLCDKNMVRIKELEYEIKENELLAKSIIENGL